MSKGIKKDKPNPDGKITLVLKGDYALLQQAADEARRTKKAQAELIIHRHLHGSDCPENKDVTTTP